MSRMYGWKAALALLCALWAGPVAQVWAEAPITDGHRLVVMASYGCAIEQEGRLGCFGYHESALGPPPEGRYLSVSLSSGWDSACAVRSDGEAVCWAKSGANQLSPPPGPWRSLSMGFQEACGLRPDGQMVCWGDGGPLAPPSGPFLALSISNGHGCAIRNDGTLQCWKRYDNDELGSPPPGRFSQVAVSDYHACGLRSDGRVLCWGQSLHGNTDAPAEGGFIDVSVGLYNGCALRVDGTVACWGSRYGAVNFLDPMESPQGRFTELATGETRACGRRFDGLVACWGDPIEGALQSPYGPPLARLVVGGGEGCILNADGDVDCFGDVPAMRPPPGRYLRLSLGDASGCGLLLDGSARCWGAPLGPVPTATLTEVSVGEAHACGVKADAGVVCWGDNAAGQLDVPPGEYRAVLAGDRYSCALSTEGTVTCWGDDPLVAGVPVGGGFRTLLGSDGVICASRETGPAKCWGEGGTWLSRVMDAGAPVVALGSYFACYLQSDGMICEGDSGQAIPDYISSDSLIAAAAAGGTLCIVEGLHMISCGGGIEFFERPYATMRIGTGAVAVGAAHTCNLASDGLVDCWGDNAHDQRAAPALRARALSVEADHACAIATDGGVRCWGDGIRGGNQPLADLLARDVDVGQFNGCAVGGDGDAACWGWNVNGQGTPPAGAFHQVVTGLNHSCGLRDDNTLVCWGYGADGQTAAPAGAFIAVEVGERHSCAIAADGGLQCWGLDAEGQAAPPVGSTYRALSSGAFHNCAIRSDGALACWGRNDQGQATPPQGRFASVSAGVTHSCAVRDDGTRVCWGNSGSGQSPSLAIGPDALPRGERDQPYEARLAATGSAGYTPRAATFRRVSGALPSGIDLDADGLLHGWPQAEGVFDVAIEARDVNGFSAQRAYRIEIGVPRDTVPPQIEFVATGPVGDNGWFVGDVGIRWLYDSPQSGIDAVFGCEDQVVTYDAAQLILHCTVDTRGGGTHSVSRTLKRDATPPRLSIHLQPAAPNGEGWYRTQVTALYGCLDMGGSGIAEPCPGDYTVSADGTQTFPPRSVRDRAGNIGVAPPTSVKIDKTRPELSATMPPAQLFVGATHDFQLSASDALSGIASQSCTPVDTSTPSASDPGSGLRVATCTAIDRAGNSTSVTSMYEVVPQARRTGGAGQPVQQTVPASQRVRRVMPQPIRGGEKPAKSRAR